MNFDPNIHAELVYDGGDAVHVPERLGKPRPDQMQGTPLEQLAELAGRVCYDSLGDPKARASAAYHAHILDVGHLSVYEHCTQVLELPIPPASDARFLSVLFNRPGLSVEWDPSGRLRLTVNLRAVLEFNRAVSSRDPVPEVLIERYLRRAAQLAAPQVVRDAQPVPVISLRPATDAEKWITLLMCGSRGMSHELVRHGDFTAISQRSTRFVDESDSPWVEHPLISKYQEETESCLGHPIPFGRDTGDGLPVFSHAQDAYSEAVSQVQNWLIAEGVDKLSARKQARGAARGYLGNALYTEVIFSASVAQWRRMLKARCSDAADAEIRVLFARALGELQRSRYGDHFAAMRLRPAQDGIGEVLDS